MTEAPVVAPKSLSWYQRLTDWVSWAMGTPGNLTFWILAVATWVALGPYLGTHNILPGWASSNSWNFPLNTGESTAELYIGFLVASAANRSERRLEETLAKIDAQEQQIRVLEDRLCQEMTANTDLTREVHTLATTIAGQTALLDEVHRHVSALAPGAGEFPPGKGM